MAQTSENQPMCLSIDDLAPEEIILGHADSMRTVRLRLFKVAATDVPVLIRGESGTGKEVLAKLIHLRSSRGSGPFVKIPCPAIPGTLLESELFGYEKGAFTGAYSEKPGLVELANLGTLFLDEIAELDISLQSKLLQLLQDGQFCRIGGKQDRRAEVRILCSTNHSLEKELQSGAFRADLYYRINVVTIDVPALRDRRRDIPSLLAHFLDHYNRYYNCATPAPSARLMERLLQYDWPGNIRELENLAKRYVILGSEDALLGDIADEQNLWEDGQAPDGSVSLRKLTRQAMRDMERKIILQTLRAKNWNRKEAARALQISYRGLFYKLKQTGVPSKTTAESAPQGQRRQAALRRKEGDR